MQRIRIKDCPVCNGPIFMQDVEIFFKYYDKDTGNMTIIMRCKTCGELIKYEEKVIQK